MIRPTLSQAPSFKVRCFTVSLHHMVVTAPPPKHPNPSNFANRSREEMSKIGHRGGKKSGKARGVGGFHDMDPEKQVGQPDSVGQSYYIERPAIRDLATKHAIASRGGRAARKVAEQSSEALGQSQSSGAQKHQSGRRSHEPPIIAPTFEEWQT
ncbi:hypothetical protein N7539_000342 [Penicillium diatomitis]|uniref:Conidiation-specific protein Con-10 n=1 Tax=Penicillium diatomitis TaxID=2819901 RepID=A0A9W9XLK2_9EURO|nr:uncharacterized protein N7539_000342 [Penicillium diatomitis]KAJ5495226.1 hypothetical protein N7539_000342 [Penicillium diatomitis]